LAGFFLLFPSLPPETGFARFLGDHPSEGPFMHVDILVVMPVVALLFGILILILPRLLNYLVAIYLILIGLTGLFPHLLTTPIST
jgi:hypothetical protein